MDYKYYNKKIDELYEEFNSNYNGLNDNKVIENRKKYGENILDDKKSKSVLRIFFEQFSDILVIVLIFSAIISMITGGVESAIVIFFVLILNASIGTIQYKKSEKSLSSLKKLAGRNSIVLRNGKEQIVKSSEVVVGDILVLKSGDIVNGDARIIEDNNLEVDESSLTGESISVLKNNHLIEEKELVISECTNIVFSGTMITNGVGKAIIYAVGGNTEIGKIALAINETKDEKTPLEESLDSFSKYLALGIILICIGVFILNVYRNMKILDALMFAVALAVAAIPEALSTIVTIVLAIGTQKMAQEKAIVKQLKAVEGLGCVNVICTDKTGTLTENKMRVDKLVINRNVYLKEEIDKNDIASKLLLMNAILCNNSSIDSMSTEGALLKISESVDIEYIRKKYIRLSEIPFDSTRKIMSTLNFYEGKNIVFTKGGLDEVLNRCNYYLEYGSKRVIDKGYVYDIKQSLKRLSEKGLRVISFAYKEVNKKNISFVDEDNLIFLGLVGIIDPPKKEAKEAIKDTYTAHIKPVMITGDHKITALAIAKDIGIYKDGDLIVTGNELSKMDDNTLDNVVENVSVYARVTPNDKLRITNSWQRKNKIVAFVGDGVNDAPAIKKANIGISMGINGTEVSKEASSIILMDDNYSTIIKAIRNGRNIYDNIQNAIKFLISGNAAAIIAVVYTSLLALPIPFADVHLLFINLLTDSLPAIAIGMEPMKKDLIKQKPRRSSEFLVSKKVLFKIIIEGLLIAFFTILSYYMGLKVNSSCAKTCVFLTLCSARLFHGFNCRGEKSIFSEKIKNKAMYISFVLGMVMLNIVIFVPKLHSVFKIWPLSNEQILYAYIYSLVPTVLIQLGLLIKEKYMIKRTK